MQADEKGQINSLSTVLSQEVDRFNNLLRVLKVRINNTKMISAIKILWVYVDLLARYSKSNQRTGCHVRRTGDDLY